LRPRRRGWVSTRRGIRVVGGKALHAIESRENDEQARPGDASHSTAAENDGAFTVLDVVKRQGEQVAGEQERHDNE
jgi:hypothetical protein